MTKISCTAYETADWSLVPAHMWEGMKSYIEHGRMPGSFLTAVLQGDLSTAALHADYINAPRLADYAKFLAWYAPSGCHGSVENVEAWEKRGGLNGHIVGPDNGLPKIYAFVNGVGGFGYIGSAIAEDGTVLAGHASSSAGWSRHDMGADGHSTWKHDVYAKHYPDGFQVEWVDDVKSHSVLWAIIEKLNAEVKANA